MAALSPLRSILMHASLSSSTLTTMGRPSNTSHKVTPGIPSVRSAKSNATTSASGVLWETHVWRFEHEFKGKKVLGPWMHRNTPDVDLAVSTQPAKSASA